MRISVIKELLLYRYRYVLGYILLVGLAVGLTVWQLGDIPPGFSDLEKQSAVISSQLSAEAVSFVNVPYHLLQKATLALFGPTALGIRLPSVISALLVVAAAYFLLRRWFSENIAIIGAVLVVTSVHFLVRGRTGSPLILYSLWPALLLLSASFANLQGYAWRAWVVVFAAVAALSLYTPYLGFLVVIILLAVLASRQGRGLFRELGAPTIVASQAVFFLLLAPLAWSIYQSPQAALMFIGLGEAPTLAFVTERLKEMAQTLVSLGGGQDQPFTPVLSIPALLLGIYGLIYTLRRVGRTRYAIIALWLFTATALFLSTEQVPLVITFVPISLLIIIGLWRFIQRWYELFPRNPYARMAGLLPIALLLFVMIQFNYNRYFYALPRGEKVRTLYDADIMLLNDQLHETPELRQAAVVVDPERLAFFSLLADHYEGLTVTTAQQLGSLPAGKPLVIAEPEYPDFINSRLDSLGERQVRLVVDDRPDGDALRFRIYR